MILFRIGYCYDHRDNGYRHRFIIAKNENKAVEKYLEVVDIPEGVKIEIGTVCERDEIIPTIEPKEEFKTKI